MNQIPLRRFTLMSLLSAVCLAARLAGAQDNAANNVYTNGWWSGTNGGAGFGPWTLVDNNTPAQGDYSGFFIGSAGAIDVSNQSFTMYANGNDYVYATAYRAFSNSLTTNVAFTIKFQNDYIAPGGYVGFSLANGTNFTQTNNLATLTGNASFSFYFVGGNADYTIWDGNSVSDTGVPFTSGGLTLQFALTDASDYLLYIKSGDGNTILATLSGPSAGVSGATIDSFACYALNVDYIGSAGNVSFNQFNVVPTTNLPPVIQSVLPASGAIYQTNGTAITFSTFATFSTISTNNIQVTANGATVTNLAFSGSPTNWSVTALPVLAANLFYTNVITVTDNSGNVASNVFYFNTWNNTWATSPTATNAIFIEAEDYNYLGGKFLATPYLGQYATLSGLLPYFIATNGIDYLKLVIPDGGTNAYRPGDACEVEVSSNATDHAGMLTNGITNWAWDYVQYGEWMNYTRKLVTNTAYNIYACYSGGPQPTILMEHDAAATATSTNQPRVALGTFVGANTGDIVHNYNFTPLKDFFSTPVVIRFAQLTNTFRLTRIGDGFNLDYLIFVPVNNTNTQRPYITAGYPYPGASGVLPDQQITFTVANRQTTNNPALTQLIVNGADVSGSVSVTSSNAGGMSYAYTPASLYPMGSNITVRAILYDSAGVALTNDWTFYTTTVMTIPPAYALPSGSAVSNGFNMHLVKFPDNYPANVTPSPVSSAWAEAMLATNVVYTNNLSLPYTSWDTNVFFAETNTINYENCGTNQPYGWWTISGERYYPFVSTAIYTNCADTNGPNDQVNSPNNLAIAATMFVPLNAGLYQWAVRSDDGFRLTVGTGTMPTNTLIADYEGGRGADTPSVFNFIIQTNGVYPMRFLYYQGGFGGSVELYSIDRLSGQAVLLNDPTNALAVKVYRATTALTASTNANLSALTLNPAAPLNPGFASGTLSYTATEAYTNSPITVTPTSADGTATIQVVYGGATNPVASGNPSGPLTLNANPGVANLVDVRVTAANPAYVQDYFVNVTRVPSQTRPVLTNTPAAGVLTLAWPLDHLGYHLLMQTNNLNNGVSGNTNDWAVVPGSASTNLLPITITNNVKDEFFKLVYP